MSARPPPNDPRAFEGLAAIAITAAEMGASDDELVGAVGSMMLRLGMSTADEVREVAAAIGRLPQPLDEDAYERERRRPIEEMLGVTLQKSSSLPLFGLVRLSKPSRVASKPRNDATFVADEH